MIAAIAQALTQPTAAAGASGRTRWAAEKSVANGRPAASPAASAAAPRTASGSGSISAAKAVAPVTSAAAARALQ